MCIKLYNFISDTFVFDLSYETLPLPHYCVWVKESCHHQVMTVALMKNCLATRFQTYSTVASLWYSDSYWDPVDTDVRAPIALESVTLLRIPSPDDCFWINQRQSLSSQYPHHLRTERWPVSQWPCSSAAETVTGYCYPRHLAGLGVRYSR